MKDKINEFVDRESTFRAYRRIMAVLFIAASVAVANWALAQPPQPRTCSSQAPFYMDCFEPPVTPTVVPTATRSSVRL